MNVCSASPIFERYIDISLAEVITEPKRSHEGGSSSRVCIAGMHRSGTSMVTRLLRDCALFLGSDGDLMPPAPANPEGYWENMRFVNINDRILAQFGGQWNDPPRLPAGWEFAPAVDSLFAEAEELVGLFHDYPNWGWKDPRNSLTIPFWRRLIPDLKVVVCIRNPLEVARSLCERDDSPSSSQFRLWMSYYRQLLAAVPPRHRIVTHYQSYFHDPRAELRRLSDWLGLQVSAESVERATAHVFADLRHHHFLTAELEAAGVPGEVVRLYLELCAEAGPVYRQRRELAQAIELKRTTSREFPAEAYSLRLKLKRVKKLHIIENELAENHAGTTQLNSTAEASRSKLSFAGPMVRAVDALRKVKSRLSTRRPRKDLMSRLQNPLNVCFCTLAIHQPYRRRAQLLCADALAVPWMVLTDEPEDFANLPVRAIRHAPTGPMAPDYLAHLPETGDGRGAAAYHDKRFALLAAIQDFETAIYVDADSRMAKLPPLEAFPSGLAVLPVVRKSVAEHLHACGSWRMPVFMELAQHLTGNTDILLSARWCHEALVAVTKDGRESRFFEAWEVGADFLQARGVYSGEGGVIGLAATYAGWSVNYDVLGPIEAMIQHEGGGPKAV